MPTVPSIIIYKGASSMNYLKIYIQLIRNAQSRKLLPKNIYTEKHHIFPRSIFGDNKFLVDLTLREHYFAHLLLFKRYANKYGKSNIKTIKMFKAFNLMSGRNKINSRKYKELREKYYHMFSTTKNKKYYNNGKINKMIKVKEIPKYEAKGWKPGTLTKSTLDTKCYNNGKINKIQRS